MGKSWTPERVRTERPQVILQVDGREIVGTVRGPMIPPDGRVQLVEYHFQGLVEVAHLDVSTIVDHLNDGKGIYI